MSAGASRSAGKQRLTWKHSKRYLATRRRKATRERKLAAHRKSLHGRLVHEIVAVGNTVITEKISYRAWQKQFGKSVGLRAPGMFIELLKRTVASTGGTLVEVPTRTHQTLAILSWLRPVCARSRCGSAGTSAPVASGPSSVTSTRRFWPPIWTQQILFPRVPGTSGTGKVGSPACRQHTSKPSNAQVRGSTLPRSFGIPGVGARLPKSPRRATQEPLSLREGKLETWKQGEEPPGL